MFSVLEINRKNIFSAKKMASDFCIKKDQSSSIESVAKVEVTPVAEKAGVFMDISTEVKTKNTLCEDEYTNLDASFHEEIEIALSVAESVRVLVRSCCFIVNTITDIFSDGLIKIDRAIEIISRVQHAEKDNFMVTSSKYVSAIEVLLNKSYEVERAVEEADTKAGWAEVETTGWHDLLHKKSNYAEDDEVEVTIAKVATKQIAIRTWEAANDAVEATKGLWQEIDDIRNMEAGLKKLIKRINRKGDYSILYVLIIAFILGCIIGVINNLFKIDIYSTCLISMTGCLLLLRSKSASFVTGLHYHTDKEYSVEEMEKSKSFEILEKCLHDLNKDLIDSKTKRLSRLLNVT